MSQAVWAAATRDDAPHFYREAHLVRTSEKRWDRGWQDTRCGASGSPGSFTRRAARGKRRCAKCLKGLQTV